jgi:hypothetical protein
MDQMRLGQKATVGLQTGGDARKIARGKQNPEHKPSLAETGIDKNLAKEGRRIRVHKVSGQKCGLIKNPHLPKPETRTGGILGCA